MILKNRRRYYVEVMISGQSVVVVCAAVAAICASQNMASMSGCISKSQTIYDELRTTQRSFVESSTTLTSEAMQARECTSSGSSCG